MTNFLYPFIEGDECDAVVLLDDLASSARAKAVASRRLRADTYAQIGDDLAVAAGAIADRLSAGGRLFTFGNGGSSTDAASIASLFARPPWGRALASRSLVDDTAVLTALGNDVGFDLVFSRQLIAHGRAGDAALGLSTSGSSTDVLNAFAEARRRGLLTIGFAGYDGGQMVHGAIDHCLVVGADSVHRIQETQASLGFALWRAVQDHLQEAR